MRLPIVYALSYPGRITTGLESLDLANLGELTFKSPRTEIFRNLALAFEALRIGGNVPCILNAANEIAVNAFLDGSISFLVLPDIIEHCMYRIGYIEDPVYQDYVDTDNETREVASALIKSLDK
jgi:1-deoxy-D-xylulose-5-phosphate reductoisomerase